MSDKDLQRLKDTLTRLRIEGKVLIALLYGSFAGGTPHRRSDIDIALYVEARDERDDIDIMSTIVMACDREVSILRLDDEDESPFIIQEALKGVHLVEPDKEMLYEVSRRALHESESIRFRREAAVG